MDDETRDILTLVKTNAQGNDPELNIDDYKFDRGLTYDWGERVFPQRDALLEGGTWLREEILAHIFTFNFAAGRQERG